MRTKTFDKQSSKIEYFGNWTGLAGGVAVESENAFNQLYGAGKIGKDKAVFVNTSGTSAVPLREGVDFQYGKRLDASITEDSADGFGTVAGGIIDTGESGALTKPIRIKHGSYNIKNASGLNLKMYARNLSLIVSPPPSDRMWVDPLTGKYMLPGPIYWSKADTIAGLISPEIKNNISSIVLNTGAGGYSSASEVSGRTKFGPAWRFYVSSDPSTAVYDNLEINFVNPLTSFTISFWMWMHAASNAGPVLAVFIPSNNNKVQIQNILTTDRDTYYATGGTQRTTSVTTNFADALKHIQIVYDTSKSLGGSYAIRLYINGTRIFQSTYLVTETINKICFQAIAWYAVALIYVDNIKIWDYAIDDTTMEYNSGNGRLGALHPIFSASEYIPENITDGYFYKAEATTPASLPKASGAGSLVRGTI